MSVYNIDNAVRRAVEIDEAKDFIKFVRRHRRVLTKVTVCEYMHGLLGDMVIEHYDMIGELHPDLRRVFISGVPVEVDEDVPVLCS